MEGGLSSDNCNSCKSTQGIEMSEALEKTILAMSMRVGEEARGYSIRRTSDYCLNIEMVSLSAQQKPAMIVLLMSLFVAVVASCRHPVSF